MRVVDVGAGANPHPQADLTVDQRPCADKQADLTDEWPLETASVDRLIARHVFEHLPDLTHAFEEAGRVLRVGGELNLVMPLGHDAVADDDHDQRWTWKSPIQYCLEQGRPWDPDVPFVLEARDLRGLRLVGPLRPLTPLLQAAGRVWPAWAAYRCYDGELYARYRRVRDGD